MKYDFDEIIERKGTDCVKYDLADSLFGVKDILPMWVADMDFKTPDFIIEALRHRLEHPVLGYFYHNQAFYDSIIQWMKRRHQWNIQKEWIHFSPGIVSGLAVLVQAFTEEGDKILIQPPVYHPFYYVIENQHRILVKNPLKLEGDRYQMDYQDLEKKLKDGVKMMIFCNPHNPLARCWEKEELKHLAELCLQYNCLVISDEIHADLTLPGYRHIPLASLSPEIANNTITCMAPSKTFNIAGMSTSEIIIPNLEYGKRYEEFIDSRLHLQMGNSFGDVALTAAYTHGDEWLDQLREYIANNVHFVQSFVKEYLPKLKTYRHEATYVLWIDFRELNIPHEKLKEMIAREAKLGLNDGMIFGEEGAGFMRMNLACPLSTVRDAMQRLEKLFSNHI